MTRHQIFVAIIKMTSGNNLFHNRPRSTRWCK